MNTLFLLEVEELSIFKLAFDPNSLWIMIPLFLMLGLEIYIFIERWLTINSASKDDRNFMNNIRDFIHDGKLDSAMALCKGNDTPLARMIEKGLTRIGKPLNDVAAAIENTGVLEVQRLERRVPILATIAAIAPMLGFLGTVVGMVIAFHNMAANPNNLDITVLSSGIYTAMITTIAGLIVGIIAYVFYNMLVSKISQVVHVLEAKTTEFMDLLHEPV
ncbi:MAG TPA: MotA/TolQ/ExbB proton channel family protein [Bacteroidales bacterium]|jgi:biopolymer transport protein ExbB|nr:MotA/TolQ/ExbB proton channel family protein [Bacteroidales bacterium]HNW68256.1 MotA/TolQ/ExbB proton channel family protein [Bacteroidales bacterium]HPT53085.1 MotA/TolQ/ExbB proton channel family protein [Bacteroidales bacterium]